MWWTLQRWSAQPVFQPKSEETRRRQGSGVITFMRRRPVLLWLSGCSGCSGCSGTLAGRGVWIVQCSGWEVSQHAN